MKPSEAERKLQILEHMGFSRANPLSILTSETAEKDKGVYQSKCFINEELRLNSYRKKIYKGQASVNEAHEAVKQFKKVED